MHSIHLRFGLFAALSIAALGCSDSDADTGGASGAAGSLAAGSGGAAAGSAGSTAQGGASAGSAGSPAGGAASGGAGSGGEAQGGAGGATAGAGGLAGTGGNATAGAGGMPGAAFQLTSLAFAHVEACTTANRMPCNFFPAVNTFTNIGGMNQSPELNWTAGPAGTMSYVMCLHDTSVGATGATHWCLWNIPGSTRSLPANLARQKMPAVPAGSSQDGLSNDDGYVGPGARGNVYQFRIFALNVASYTPPNAEDRRTVYAQLEANATNLVLGTSTLRGRANPQQ